MIPLVSIIVPNYNHEKFLKQRLNSILDQTFQDFEVILLDDLSTDSSLELLKDYSKNQKVISLEFNETNSGSPFIQWNKGIEMAKGKYVWIAESDDFSEKDFLQSLVDFHEQNSNIALAYTQSCRINSLGEIRDIWPNYSSDPKTKNFNKDLLIDGNLFIEKFLIHKNVIPNVSSVLFKRDSLKRILPLKVESYLRYTADWYYYIQILCNSKVGFIAKPLNYFRYHESSVIANADIESGWLTVLKMELRARREMITYLEKQNPANLKKIKKQSKFAKNHIYYLIAKGYINRGKRLKALQVVIKNPWITGKVLNFGYHKK